MLEQRVYDLEVVAGWNSSSWLANFYTSAYTAIRYFPWWNPHQRQQGGKRPTTTKNTMTQCLMTLPGLTSLSVS
jgi:hypothetical protein